MKNFTKFIFALLAFCCIAGVQSVNAATEKVYATFENPSPAGNAQWNAETKTFTWSGNYSNAINNIGLPSGNITKYEKLVVDCDIVSGGHYRVLLYSTNKGTTSFQIKIEESGKVEIKLGDYVTDEDYLINCSQICLSGGSTASGEVKVNELYLETFDSEAIVDNTKKHASFVAPQNSGENTSWDAETRTFGWITPTGNQLKNIGLPNGDITRFKKLVIDCELGEGTQQFRILVYKKNNGDAQTLWVKNSGVTEFNLKLLISEDYLKECDYICLSGSGNTGSAIINDLYLETYPEGESFDDVLLTASIYHNWNGVGADASITTTLPNIEVNFEKEMGQGSTIFGDGNVSNLNYADLTGCSKMIIKGTPGIVARTMWNRQVDNSYLEILYTITESGSVEVDFKNDERLKDCEYLHLNAIKFPYNGLTGTIDNITFAGDFELAVVDGKNFTPTFKEYNTASYERTFNTAYTYGTICLPFAPDAATCENYTFYKLDQASANTLMFVEEEAPKANTAYLYRPKDATATNHAFTGGETTVSTEVAATTSGDWSFIGSLKNATIDLTADGSFYAYKPDANNGENKISKATNSMSVKPYRAYFHYTGTGNAVATMRVIVRGDGTTGIEEVITPDQIESVAPTTIYNLMGQPVAQPVKGQIYIVNGKKVVY